MAPTIAAVAPMAFAPGPLLGQLPVSPTAATSQVSSPSSGRVQPTKLFIGGISRRTTTKQLRDHFSQGGRVLDCVAMRTPDGRPRGFGYVTLDSPVAAERFILEPQMIDDRIVDMKLAVPEDHASKAVANRPMFATAPNSFMTESAMSMPMQDFYPQANTFYPWTDDATYYYGAGFDGLAMTHVDWQQSAVADPAGDCNGLLDCVGLLTGAPDLNGQWDAWKPEDQVEGCVGTDLKSPLAEVTNLLSNSQAILGKKSSAIASPDQTDPKVLKPARIPITPSGPAEQPFFVFEDGQATVGDGDNDEASTEPGAFSPNGSADLSPGAPSSTEANLVVADGLPSIGSAGHEAGECRRCNFFAKGRCQNGYDCEFCHLTHERQKLTRQEKRDQRASRDETRQGENLFSDVEMAMPAQVPLSADAAEFVRGPPGLSLPEPLVSVAPQTLLSVQAPSALPDSVFRTDATRFSGLSTSPIGLPSCLLSTSPQSLACTPAGFSKNTAKEMCTTGTQTDDDFACPHCSECGEGFEGESSVCEGCKD